MSATVFYSWQSDLPNRTNRGLIGKALEDAARQIADDVSITVDPRIESDTLGAAGAVDIASTILAKIDAATAFVADVSIVHAGGVGRPMPNPNVLIELGYAIKRFGFGRVVLALNRATGRPEDLPFDLRGKRVVTYEALDGDGIDRASERLRLTNTLKSELERIFGDVEREASAIAARTQPTTRLSEIIAIEPRRIEADALVNREASRVRALLDAENVLIDWSPDELRARVARYEESVTPLVETFAAAGRWAPTVHDRLWPRVFERVANPTIGGAYADVWVQVRRYPALRLLYAAGVAAVDAHNWGLLRSLLEARVREGDAVSPAAMVLHAPDTFGDAEKSLPGMEKKKAPLADHLFATLREPLHDQLPTDEEYEGAFERFEAMVALVHSDLRPEGLWEWAPIGRFAWRRRDVFSTIRQEAERDKTGWPPVNAGLFGGDLGRFEAAFARVAAFLGKVSTW